MISKILDVTLNHFIRIPPKNLAIKKNVGKILNTELSFKK